MLARMKRLVGSNVIKFCDLSKMNAVGEVPPFGTVVGMRSCQVGKRSILGRSTFMCLGYNRMTGGYAFCGYPSVCSLVVNPRFLHKDHAQERLCDAPRY